MDTNTRGQHSEALNQRQDAIAEAWYRAVGRTSYVALPASQIRARLADLLEEVIALFLSRPLDRGRAEGVGAALADMHLLQAESLSNTLEVLGRELALAGQAAGHPDLESHLSQLMGALAAGHYRQSCRIILSEQEEARTALVTELRLREQEVRHARDELEVRVQERTAELARVNEGLRAEIAQRKRAERALQESEERWRSLVENAPDIVVTIDRRGRILYVNRVAEMAAETVEDLVGADVFGYVQPEHRPALREALDAAFEGQEGGYLEIVATGARGVPTWQAVRASPVWRDGQVGSVIAMVRDISDQKRVEELKDNLIRDVSHELRTPLAKVRMSLDVLGEIMASESPDRARAERIGQLATRNVERLLRTVEGILDLSRLENGIRDSREHAIALEELVEEVVQYMGPLASARGLGLEAELPKERLPLVVGDRERLFRVLVNLLDNAIKFTPEGRVLVSAQVRDGSVEVAVADTGQGIEPEVLERVFERFYQGKTHAEGVGIGLTICRAVIEIHGGRIWAESSGPGQGATFRFTLPPEPRGG